MVNWVTKSPAVSSPSLSKMPVLPTRSANTTVVTMAFRSLGIGHDIRRDFMRAGTAHAKEKGLR